MIPSTISQKAIHHIWSLIFTTRQLEKCWKCLSMTQTGLVIMSKNGSTVECNLEYNWTWFNVMNILCEFKKRKPRLIPNPSRYPPPPPDIIKLISGNDSIIILHSCGTLVIHIQSWVTSQQSIFIKHVKINFVQVLSLCSLSCMIFIDLPKLWLPLKRCMHTALWIMTN